MSRQTISPTAARLENLLSQKSGNSLQDFSREVAHDFVLGKNLSPSDFSLFIVRNTKGVGDEIFGPKPLQVAKYTESELYGASGSSSARFRTALLACAARARQASGTGGEDVEYGHQATLLWAEVGRLKEFVGLTPDVSGMVAALRTARFQYLGKDTPPTAVKAIADAIGLVVEAARWDEALVDRFVDILELGGFDSFAPDALRPDDAS